MTKCNEHENTKHQDGDSSLNPSSGGMWVLESTPFGTMWSLESAPFDTDMDTCWEGVTSA